MNERVVELYKQALKFAYETAGVDTEKGTILASLTAGRFAELIVRECLDIVNRKEYSYHEADPLWETSQLIKEHFGVEE